MAFRFLGRRSLLATKQSLTSVLSHSSSSVFRLRPLAAVASTSYFRRLVPGISARTYLTEDDIFSMDEPLDPANSPPKEQLLIEGCDLEHWFVLMDDPEGDPTRDDLIDTYIKTLAKVVGSEEEARMKIYSVSTRHYYAFGAAISEELSEKLKGLPGVRWVLPDSYLDPKTKNYGGEPFINGEAVPYDPKYHEDWLKNEKHNDKPPNGNPDMEEIGCPYDYPDDLLPRNSGRRREMRRPNSRPNVGGPGVNFGGLPNMTPPRPRANAGPRLANMGLGGQFQKAYGNMDLGYPNLNHPSIDSPSPPNPGPFGFNAMYNNQNNFVPDVEPGLRPCESDYDAPQNEDFPPPPNY